MAKKADKEPKVNPWDRRQWPSSGDADINLTYAAVGRALSQWERYEAHLSLIFSGFVSGIGSAIATRAYCAVRTFEGRADMLRAASDAYFKLWPHDEMLAQFKRVLSEATCYAPRRNDIAHGVVEHWRIQPPTGDLDELFDPPPVEDKWALYPSRVNFKDTRFAEYANVPTYCYTSKEIDYFYERFNEITSTPSDLISILFQLGRGGGRGFSHHKVKLPSKLLS